jgi:hypothetical protein
VIHVHVIPNILEREKRETREVECVPGVTPRSLAPEGADPTRLVCTRAGVEVEGDAWDQQLTDGDHLVFWLEPQATAVAAGAALAVKASAAAVAASTPAWYLTAAIAAAKLVGVFAINFAIAKILGPSKKPSQPNEADSSTTYDFRGIQSNAEANGAAIPVVYGRHRVAGPIIAQTTRTFSAPAETFLYLLMVLGEGPVESIGGKTADGGPFTPEAGDLPEGLHINGQPAENYRNLECHVRLGTLTQEHIPGFEDVQLEYSVEQGLTESEDPGPENVELAAGTYTPGVPADDAELAKWDTVVSYTAQDNADEFVARVAFDRGLYAIDPTSGAVLNNSARFQIRYIEVDGGGTPTGDYVVLHPESQVANDTQASMAVEFPHDFMDPASITFPGPGRYLQVETTGAGAYVSSPTGIPAQLEPGISISLWFARTMGIPPDGTKYPIVRQGLDGASPFDGWALSVSSPALGLYLFHFEFGDGSAVWSQVSDASFPAGSAFAWRHIGVTFGAGETDDLGGYARRANFYIDGYHSQPFPTNSGWVKAETEDIVLGRHTGKPAYGFRVDELIISNKVLHEVYFQALRNEGSPLPRDANFPGLVGGWHMDDATAIPWFGTYTSDFSGNGNVLEMQSPSHISSGAEFGIVEQQPSGPIKRALYKVEIQRLDAEDADGYAQNEATWASIQLIQQQQFRYPGTALLAVKIRATDQLNTGRPSISVPVKGRKVPVWDGNSETYPVAPATWSSNPAWVMLDMLTAKHYGLGAYHSLRDMDLPSLKEWADWCDEWVPDGRGVVGATDADFTVGPPDEVEITLDGGVSDAIPDVWGVGTRLSIQAASDSDYDTGQIASTPGAGYHGLEVLSVVDDPPNGTRIFTCRWPSALTDPADPAPSGFSAQVRGLERRMSFDGVFDRADERAWDAVLKVAQTARATPVRRGSRIGAWYDAPRDQLDLIGMGSMVPGSFEIHYSNAKDRPNAIAVEIWDEDQAYERNIVELEADEQVDPTQAEEYRRRRYRREGVTRRSQALREAKYELNTHRLRRRLTRYEAGVQAVHYLPGDVIGVAHDVPEWGVSGRLQTDSSNASRIVLDREVTLAGSEEVQVVHTTTGDMETRTISTAAGTYPAGTTLAVSSAFSFIPSKDDAYSVGATSESSRLFTVLDTSLQTATLRRKVEAVEYDEDVYDDDFGELAAGEVETLHASTAFQGIPSNVRSLTLSEEVSMTPDGSYELAIQADWSLASGEPELVGGVDVWVSDENGDGTKRVASLSGPATSARITGPTLQAGTTYQVHVQPISRLGARQDPAWTSRRTVALTGLSVAPEAPTGVSARLAGEVAVYEWNHPGHDRAKSFEVRRGGWVLGQRVGTAPAGERQLETTNWVGGVANSHGESAPRLFVRSRIGTGQVSSAASVEFAADPAAMLTGGEGVLGEIAVEDFSWGGTKVNLAMATVGGRDILEFTGAGLEGSYETAGLAFEEARWIYLQAFADAEQIHPVTWDGSTGTWDGPAAQQWSWEGPLWLDDAWPSECGLRVFVRHSLKATTSGADWVEYRPGRMRCRSFDVRIEVTRPSSSYDVRINRLAILATRKPRDQYDHLTLGVFS